MNEEEATNSNWRIQEGFLHGIFPGGGDTWPGPSLKAPVTLVVFWRGKRYNCHWAMLLHGWGGGLQFYLIINPSNIWGASFSENYTPANMKNVKTYQGLFEPNWQHMPRRKISNAPENKSFSVSFTHLKLRRGPGWELSWLEHRPETPRLQVPSLVRAPAKKQPVSAYMSGAINWHFSVWLSLSLKSI